MAYRSPTREEMEDPLWNRIWEIVKYWDIRTPEAGGYSSGMGNHVCAIYDAVKTEALPDATGHP